MAIDAEMEIRTYRAASGHSPFRAWYNNLDDVVRARVVRALDRLKQGNFSSTKPVGSGVHEFRIDFGPGYRVYFAQSGQDIVLLLTGGDKRRQQRDINAAIAYWDDHKRRGRNP